MYKAEISITLRPSILDVQGKAVEQGIHTLGLEQIQHVRIGKYITLSIDTENEQEARRITEDACKKLLANPVMEDFTFTLEQISQ